MAEAVAERETPLSPARRSHPHLEAVENLPQSARQTGLEAAGMNDYFLAVDRNRSHRRSFLT
jgi:hypothetical protein